VSSAAPTGEDLGAPPRRGGNPLLTVLLRRQEASVVVVAVALIIYFEVVSDFLAPGNVVTISQYVAAPTIVAIGEVLLLVSGQIDLSVGSVFVLAPFLMHYAIDFYGVPAIPAIVLALLVCGVIGLVNGFVTVVLEVPSFITTLGMLFAIQGFTLTTSHAYPAEIPAKAAGLATVLGHGDWSELVWALALVLIFQVVLSYTRWGLHTVAVGGNPVGAREAGIRSGRILMGNFVLASVLGGFAGVLEAFRVNTISPPTGDQTLMFTAISAAVIGGTALAGGSGTIIGALLGAVVLGVLKDGFNLIGLNAYTFDLILGLAILLAMISNVRLDKLRKAGRR
jgi:simple sugar transport system permease protein